jgi:hypothetical protein
MLSLVSCANAANESTACDVFMFPEQWKCISIGAPSQTPHNRVGKASSKTHVFIE